MNKQPQRIHAIELTLTPKEIVVVWLRNAMQAGSFEENSRDTLGHRGRVMNAVFDAVKSSLKGQPEPLVERAIRHAQREADLLYLLVVNANSAVLEDSAQRNREYCLLLGYLSAEMHQNSTKERARFLRPAVLMFIEPVFILEAAIAQVVSEHLEGQPVLFSDSTVKLAEQLKMANDMSTWFNDWAIEIGAAEINLKELRTGLRSEADRRIALWVSLCRITMLSLLGKTEEMHAALDQCFHFFEPVSNEANNVIPG